MKSRLADPIKPFQPPQRDRRPTPDEIAFNQELIVGLRSGTLLNPASVFFLNADQ
jgi:hypothetical protein